MDHHMRIREVADIFVVIFSKKSEFTSGLRSQLAENQQIIEVMMIYLIRQRYCISD